MPNPSSFSTKIDLSLAEKLKNDLLEQGFSLSTPPYTVFCAKKEGLSCTLYSSGSLTVQGKDTPSFLEFYLEPEILHTFSFSHPQAHLDTTPRIGMDEAGKGDFFGPLCIAALFADEAGIASLLEMGVCDSKKLSDPQILRLYPKLQKQFPHAIVRLSPKKYNELYARFHNLNHLLAWGHATALEEVFQKTNCPTAILDQFAHPSLVENMVRQKKLPLSLTQRVRGEEDPVVAAASILARAAFVQGIEELEKEYHLSFPKGATHVLPAARLFVDRHGKEALNLVAKTHFVTAKKI